MRSKWWIFILCLSAVRQTTMLNPFIKCLHVYEIFQKHIFSSAHALLLCFQRCICSDLWTRWLVYRRVSAPPDEKDRSVNSSRRRTIRSVYTRMNIIAGGKNKIKYDCGCVITKLSRRLATMEAKRLSPANSEIRKMYSGAVTWLERWVRPVGEHTHFTEQQYTILFNLVHTPRELMS